MHWSESLIEASRKWLENKEKGISRCPMCGGKKKAGKTVFTADLGFGVVVVRDVPAMVCEMCGESWLDDATARCLEKIVDDLRSKHSMVEVLNWQDVERVAA